MLMIYKTLLGQVVRATHFYMMNLEGKGHQNGKVIVLLLLILR